jgi:hypothetical protein
MHYTKLSTQLVPRTGFFIRSLVIAYVITIFSAFTQHEIHVSVLEDSLPTRYFKLGKLRQYSATLFVHCPF